MGGQGGGWLREPALGWRRVALGPTLLGSLGVGPATLGESRVVADCRGHDQDHAHDDDCEDQHVLDWHMASFSGQNPIPDCCVFQILSFIITNCTKKSSRTFLTPIPLIKRRSMSGRRDSPATKILPVAKFCLGTRPNGFIRADQLAFRSTERNMLPRPTVSSRARPLFESGHKQINLFVHPSLHFSFHSPSLKLRRDNVGPPGFEPGVTCTQNRHVSRYTTAR